MNIKGIGRRQPNARQQQAALTSVDDGRRRRRACERHLEKAPFGKPALLGCGNVRDEHAGAERRGDILPGIKRQKKTI